MSLDPAQRGALLRSKLTALVREHGAGRDWLADATPASVGSDAALLSADGAIGWVLVDDDHRRALGRALTWATTRGIEQLHLFVDADAPDDATGVLARRAGLFGLPDDAPTVWSVRGRAVQQATPAGIPSVPTSHGPDADAIAAFLADAGAEVLVEHDCIIGEVMGLEVARTVHDDRGVRLEVGVGRHDREAFSIMHADVEPRAALPGVIDLVRGHRRRGAEPHPLNRIAQHRWLLRELVADPAMIGLRSLEPVAGPVARSSVDEVAAACAIGVDEDGAPVVVAVSIGVDPDVVPTAVDLWAQRAPEAEVLVVVPARDAVPSTQRVAASAVAPVRVVTVADDWRA